MQRTNFVTVLGRAVIAAIAAVGASAIMLGDALAGLLHGNVRARDRLTAMMALVGIESLPIVLITLFFGGMVLGLHTAKILVLYGAGPFVGSVVAISVAREVGPTFTGIVVAARIGSAFAAELGTMKITNQVDALRALAVNPVHYLVTPRLIAAAIMLPILTMYADMIGMFGGAIISITTGGVSYQTFITSATTYLQVYDVAGGLLKTMIFGIIIAITSCHIGLSTEGGAAGVGRSTTAAVVWSIVLLYGSNFIMSWLLYAYRGF